MTFAMNNMTHEFKETLREVQATPRASHALHAVRTSLLTSEKGAYLVNDCSGRGLAVHGDGDLLATVLALPVRAVLLSVSC